MKFSRIATTSLMLMLAAALSVGLSSVMIPLPAVDDSSQPAQPPKKQKWGDIGNLPNEWFYIQRAYPAAKVDPVKRVEAADKYRSIRDKARIASALSPEAALNWQLAGPTNIPGRITDLAVDPTDRDIIYAASAGAGIFKTIDGGLTWRPIFDEVGTYSMGAVTVDPNNPNVIYAGTGEINGRVQTYDGTGLYKSIDAGETWTLSGLPLSYGIGRILVDPNNSDIVFAAAMGRLWESNPERGIYRSTDAGATWDLVFYLSDYTGCAEIIIHPSTGTLFAAMWERSWSLEDTYTVSEAMVGPNSGLYRSTDGGDTWDLMTDSDLPTGPTVGRIGLTLDPQSNRVYAFYWTHPATGTDLYRSDDLGNSWIRLNSPVPNQAVTYRGYYFAMVKTAPGDPDRVYLGGVDLFRSDNGGSSWTQISDWTEPYMYADQHAMWIDPNATSFILVGNDGGVFRSTLGGWSDDWTNLTNFPNTQFYTIAIDPHDPDRLYGGAQDRGTLRTPDGSLGNWERVLGGDGFTCLVDHTDPNVAYASWYNGNIAKSTSGGAPGTFYSVRSGLNMSDRFSWSAPFAMDPNNHNTLYIGSHRVYRTTNGAFSWNTISNDLTDGASAPGSNVISAIGVTPANSDVVYVGTGDANVWVTTNGGTNWFSRSTGLPDRWVTRVTPDPTDPAIAYVSVSGYQIGEWTPHIYRTDDYGVNWTPIGGDMPDAPINDIVVDPADGSTLYIATDFGAYYTENLGTTWSPLGEGMPMQPVLDLDFDQPTRQIVAATHGRSMYRLYLDCADGTDSDGDNLADNCDNCPDVPNIDQADLDLDGIGDACDMCPTDPNNDLDSDGICEIDDNCPGLTNPGQEDADGDGLGDLCDDCTDTDGDWAGNPGYPGTGTPGCPVDNCPDLFNYNDPDDDGDGSGNECDLCPGYDDNLDADGDGIPDGCDGCCFGMVGDVNNSGDDTPTIGDVSTMIDAKFISGTCGPFPGPTDPPLIECLAEADVNQSGGLTPDCDDITIGDISTLVDYLFITGPESYGPLPDCL